MEAGLGKVAMFSISSKSFYGSSGQQTKELDPKKLDPRIELKNRQTSLLSSSRTWRVFERQDEALTFAKSRSNGLMTFVFHETATSKRLFLVAHPQEFWLHDIEKPDCDRSSYEIIPEFTPCKLYLDLEFEREFNPNHNGNQMTDLFIKIMNYRLFKVYHLNVDRSLILDLDSSNDQKFSRHLIYQIPFLNFTNNYQVGIIVKDACTLIRDFDESLCVELGISQDDLKSLFVRDRHGKTKLFCDEGVYTKNRHFRIYKSTKPNKNSPLVLSAENSYNVHIGDPKLREEAIFLASLVSYFGPHEIVVSFPEMTSGSKMKLNNAGHSTSEAKAKNFPSPFPELDNFARHVMENEGIRCWLHFPSTRCIIYEGYRPGFCGNIGREHRSNKGMLVVDLRYNFYYRKCHDPDCFGYQSEANALPSYVVLSLQNPNCTEEEKKEIHDLLEFLETCDESAIVDKTFHGHDVDDLNIKDLNIHDGSQGSNVEMYETEVGDILQFLQSQPDFSDE